MRENDLLAALPTLFRTDDPTVLVGSGPDDCAHVRTLGGSVLSVSTDAFAEGSHFVSDDRPEDVAWKSLAASASDLAASGSRPRWAVVSLGMRRGAPDGWAERFAEGLAAAARELGLAIVGGDLVSSHHTTFVSVTVIGEPYRNGPILRSGGKPGDALVVTGSLGGSLRGRHLRPVPRMREMAALLEFADSQAGKAYGPTAAMDISDGLAIDLSRLARESGVGAVILETLLPVSDDARLMAAESGRSPIDHALSDGEDFELLVAMPADAWDAFQESPAARPDSGLAPFTRIGSLTGGRELLILDSAGEPRALAPEGYEHSW